MQSVMDTRLKTILKAFSFFVVIFLANFMVYTSQRVINFTNNDPDKSIFNVNPTILLLLLVLEMLQIMGVFCAICFAQKKRCGDSDESQVKSQTLSPQQQSITVNLDDDIQKTATT